MNYPNIFACPKKIRMIAYYKKLLSLICISSAFVTTSCKQGSVVSDTPDYFGGEIINPNSKYVFLCKNNLVIDSIELDKNNRFLKKYDTLTPGMYTFRHDPEYQYIYFDKGDSLMIRLNTQDFDNSLTFCGRGDEKNNFLIELFLKNEDVKNKSFDYYDQDFKTFSNFITKSYRANNNYYISKKEEIDWDADFDLYAKNLVEMPYLAQKEMYPIVHKHRTSIDACKDIPKNFYCFRKDIDFNNEKLMTYSPFLRYLTSMLNNITQDCKLEHQDVLEGNIKKLKVADSIFKNKKIKNAILNNIAFMYLLEDQNIKNNKSFLDQYLRLSSDKEKQKEIIKICKATQNLSTNMTLPEVELIDSKDNSHSVKDIFKRKTVVFFWSSSAMSNFMSAHKKVEELKSKHADWDFISINIDNDSKKWKEIISKYKFNNIVELHASNLNDIKDKWAIIKIHRTMLIDKDAKIINGFVGLFDANFEKNLN